MTNLIPVSDIERMAQAIVKSNFFGITRVEQAQALMYVAQAEGRHPASVAMEYDIIQNKPALKAGAMQARFMEAGGKIEWKLHTDKIVSAVFSHPQGGSIEIEWTLEMAARAGLAGKDVWKKYPRQMLRNRVIAEGVRAVYPGVSVGRYSEEEVSSFVGAKEVSVEAEIIEEKPQIVSNEKCLKLIELIEACNISDEIKEKWLKKANIECFAEMYSDDAEKLILFLEDKFERNAEKGL